MKNLNKTDNFFINKLKKKLNTNLYNIFILKDKINPDREFLIILKQINKTSLKKIYDSLNTVFKSEQFPSIKIWSKDDYDKFISINPSFEKKILQNIIKSF